ncbi:MAG TPA: phytoene/squalene synthase family protein [Gammaproteobacteria bacterium]
MNPETDEQFQLRLLQGVARTFALTIPQLPPPLVKVVANAYLLCRITDTIEDETAIPAERKRELAARFIDVVAGRENAGVFATDFYPLLSEQRLDAERELIRETARVVRITHSFSPRQQAALSKCVTVMGEGMAYYQAHGGPGGLPTRESFDNYCYHVAGVVGEMLTELYCDYSPAMDTRREELLRLAVSFGQGLQMVNILKDIWEDRLRGVCWLPRDLFTATGFELSQLTPGRREPAFEQGLATLIGIAHGHLQNALRYTLLIPAEERGLRTFCSWGIGMALLTLRKLNRRRDFINGRQVKISRRSVLAVIAATRLARGGNRRMAAAFRLAAMGLPEPREAAISTTHEHVSKWFHAGSASAQSREQCWVSRGYIR